MAMGNVRKMGKKSQDRTIRRRMPMGAEVQPDGGVHFRVWAPSRKSVEVAYMDTMHGSMPPGRLVLTPEDNGYFSGLAPDVRTSMRYGFRLDDDAMLYPDPASRQQPEGPHALSEVVDPSTYQWNDGDWRGVDLKGQVLYELHVGTFTPEGTYDAAAAELPYLVEAGMTLIELMPVAEFAGGFGWGYDGVNLFAPTRLYGSPDALRHFVDRAHALGLGVILDVVYNHFGPTGNYVCQFSKDYFTAKHHTDWGDAINFDGENCAAVRDFFTSNAGYWIDEFHFDGLRLDAVQAIVDDSKDHVLAALTREVRKAGGKRKTLVFAENEFQQTQLIRRPDDGGFGLDAVWNDDFHHAARVAMTGHADGYYVDYQGTPQELISAIKWGYLYQGQWNARQKRPRGSPSFNLPGPAFVTFLQNHDQVGNTPAGRRVNDLTSPGRYRAMTALWLLSPGTPMYFQGQEFSSSGAFMYFADHEAELKELVCKGRHGSMLQFLRMSGSDGIECFADPCDPRTFEDSKLDLSERERHIQARDLNRDLLRLRREDAVFAAQAADRVHGSVLGPEALALRFLGDNSDDRLLLLNLGRDLEWRPATDPLLAPPVGYEWQLSWSSEHPRYGGSGTCPLDTRNWYMPGHAAIVLRASVASS